MLFSGCGALTGLPAPGGGKRSAIEQELVSASSHGALVQIDLSKLKGKKVDLFVNSVGDIGAGNFVGGRMSVVSQLRGDYINAPPTITRNWDFPNYTTTTNSTSSTNNPSNSTTSGTTTSSSSATPGTTTSTTSSTTNNSSSSTTTGSSTTNSTLAYPGMTTSQQKGSGGLAQVGVQFKGLGEYHNSEVLFGSSDLQYLTALLGTYFFLKGVYVVPPSEADIDVYVNVNVFGTIRTRVDWFLANNEILEALTELEILAVEHKTGRLVMPPQDVGARAEYNEQYLVWVGPFWEREYIKKTPPPLCDFSGLSKEKPPSKISTEQNEPIEFPFRYSIERYLHRKKRKMKQDKAKLLNNNIKLQHHQVSKTKEGKHPARSPSISSNRHG